MKANTLPANEIARLLQRHRRPSTVPDQVLIDRLFEQILMIANQFVPSESGSVLIDDPAIKVTNPWDPGRGELVFVACFGEKSEQLLGQRIPASRGVVGKSYVTGEPVIILDTQSEGSFFSGFDRQMQYQTKSLICVPIRLGNSTCGVLELINRRGDHDFTTSELALLEIFAGYISTSLQNTLDAERYRELAKRDDLTGLYNDRFFHQRLSEDVDRSDAENRHLTLIFLDLDHFKNVNDRHGHLAGSQTLREVGLILAATVSAENATVARYGGDEFVIIVPDCTLASGLEIAEQIRRRIAGAFYRLDMGTETGVMLAPGTLTASIGVASYRELTFSAGARTRARKSELIKSADQAMYQAKALGKNRVCAGVPQQIPGPR